ncbi:MAG: 2-amino-4-hydroxy-6-hydroxymethyldihydropteridine diphosphokinase [Neomegalonema sp.]|nr:2-amino-4-hydroxy-6-hydroxymethyldihydropteridine diphosphokinase [Neomegalonema sp.]
MGSKRLYIGIGSNLALAGQSPIELCQSAVMAMRALGIHIEQCSSWYRSPAYPAGNGPDFINGVICAQGDISARELLEQLHRIENEFARMRPKRWAARTLDLDLLDHDGAIVPDRETLHHWMTLAPQDAAHQTPDRLLLPHPRLHERAFVLVPLAQIAPDWQHPISGRSVQELIGALPAADLAALRKITPPDKGEDCQSGH